MKKITKIYTKFLLEDEGGEIEWDTAVSGQRKEYKVRLFAKISKDKISLRNYKNEKEFIFVNSDIGKVQKIAELILEVLKKDVS